MIISKASFTLKLFLSIAYYVFVIFVAIKFVPDLISRVENFLHSFPLGIAAIFSMIALLVGTIIVSYIIVIPLVFFLEENYEDESLNQL